ncbi:MAG: AmmeMemoRadiSam system protein A [Gammaproteobacteria bacterium]|nr:AmmeMemoRadiSam system protein A [Gammaproteobacteria bacterium]
MLNVEDQETLLRVAADSIRHGLETGHALSVSLEDYPPALQQAGASFVTLTILRQLRGCIGMLTATRPLIEDVAKNAFAAAFKDSRFPPLTEAEYAQLEYHISILNPAETMEFDSEADLLQQLRPGIDGLILEDRGRRATFLPSVWESLPKPTEFLQHLKIKAGLPSDYWSNTLRMQRYTVQEFGN